MIIIIFLGIAINLEMNLTFFLSLETFHNGAFDNVKISQEQKYHFHK